MPDLSFVLEHWRELLIGAAFVALFYGGKIVDLVKSVKLPLISGSPVKKKENVKSKDTAAISYLRDRAVEVKDPVLLQEIKSVASKFFDIHSNSSTDNNG